MGTIPKPISVQEIEEQWLGRPLHPRELRQATRVIERDVDLRKAIEEVKGLSARRLPASGEVECCPAGEFFERHADQERDIEIERPKDAMKARLAPYFPVAFGERELVFSIVHDGQVVAVANTTEDSSGLGVSYISVDPTFRARGLASMLIESIVQYAVSIKAKSLSLSPYTDLGRERLQRKFRESAIEKGVELREFGNLKPQRHPAIQSQKRLRP